METPSDLCPAQITTSRVLLPLPEAAATGPLLARCEAAAAAAKELLRRKAPLAELRAFVEQLGELPVGTGAAGRGFGRWGRRRGSLGLAGKPPLRSKHRAAATAQGRWGARARCYATALPLRLSV